MAMTSSLSTQFRETGNKFYRSATDDLSPTIRRERLNKAWNNYHQAYSTAETNAEEKSSAAKNIAMSSWKIVALDCRLSMKRYYYKTAMEYFGKAYMFGRDKPEKWKTNLTQSMYGCLQDALDSIHEHSFNSKLQMLEEFAMFLPDPLVQADCYLEMANIIFAEGISALQSNDFKKCLQCMHDCHKPTEEARRLGQENVKKEASILTKDIYMHLCVAESIQARYTGDQILESILQDEECLDMDMLWDVIDWYKQSIILTRENDVEMEAITLSRLGRVYNKVLKQRTKAKECFMRCMQLVSSLMPRTFHTEEWFRESSAALELFQQEVVMRDEALKHEKYAKVKEELKEELKKLEKNNKCAEDLLKYVYKTHPPKNKDHRINTDKIDIKDLKELLKKAVTHYHPDRVAADDEKWKVLCEEITKVLTERYERYKG